MFRTMRLPAGVALVALGFGALAGCGSDNSSSTTATTATAASGTTTGATPLEATSWVLGTDALGLPGVDQYAPTAVFASGTVTGNAACNGYSGTYATSGSKMTISQVLGTQMSCGPVADAIETAYLGRLAKVATYAIDGTTLALSDASGATILSYSVSTESLTGNWNINAYLQADNQAFNSVVNGTNPTAVFGADGSLSGTTGCNSFTGTYTVKGDALTISALPTTSMPCVADVADQEAGILAALQTATHFEVARGRATLLNGANQRALELLTP